MSKSKYDPINRDELPDYYGMYTNVVRKRNGRDVVLGIDRETNVHGIEADCRVVVSSSWISGHGTVKRVYSSAPIDGGAMLMIDMDNKEGWNSVPVVACALEKGRNE